MNRAIIIIEVAGGGYVVKGHDPLKMGSADQILFAATNIDECYAFISSWFQLEAAKDD